MHVQWGHQADTCVELLGVYPTRNLKMHGYSFRRLMHDRDYKSLGALLYVIGIGKFFYV